MSTDAPCAPDPLSESACDTVTWLFPNQRGAQIFGTTLSELIPLLQISIGPVILISGIGLLLLTMTNRLARVIDRTRYLAGVRSQEAPGAKDNIERRFEILYRRSRLLRRAIFLAAVSVLLAAILIIVLFLAELFRSQVVWLIILLFIASMISLVASLIAFTHDVHLSLVALDMEFAEE